MAFVPEAALIALREGLEALLITGILVGLVTRMGRPDARKHVWLGLGAGILASLGLGFVVQKYLLDAFEEGGGAEWFELVAALTAVVILTYMVFWMWQHTRELMADLRTRVAAALTGGSLLTISALVFASVLREGVEVVLFYAALANRATPVDLAWSGVVGFIASGLLVLAILKGLARVDLQKFFAATGILLVFVAGGLLVHSVMALTGLGVLEPAPALWDTSAAVPDDGALGRVLHALVGYTATPTLLQAVAYFGYVLGVGGAYLWGLGVFHRRTPAGRRLATRRATVGVAVAAIILAGTAVAAVNPAGPVVGAHSHGLDDADHDHGDAYAAEPVSIPEGERVGILLRNHGEPVHYNETTYRSFADFVENLLVMLGYEQLLAIDQGTVLLDESRPFQKGAHVDPALMDAWTRDHAGPAVYVGSPVPEVEETRVPFFDGFYLAPGAGPGLGEPDVLEMAGLTSFLSWLQMENESPMHHDKRASLDHARTLLEERYGDDVVVQTAYHILPHVGPDESLAAAAEAFVDAGVTVVVDAYTSAIESDIMNTCMMRPHMEHALRNAGYNGPIVDAGLPATSHHYMDAVVDKVRAELAREPAGEPVAVFLTHHGMAPDSESPCQNGPDPYHEHAATMFAHAVKHLNESLDLTNVHLFQVYGQGAEAEDDGILSPLEAVDAARAAGATRVVDLPYELPGNGYDNLVNHRANYGLEPHRAPHHDANYETHLTLHGVSVRIASSAFGATERGAALADVVEQALAEAFPETD